LSSGDREVVDSVRSELDLEDRKEERWSVSSSKSDREEKREREREDTDSIGLDDLHVVSVDPDVEHSESGHWVEAGKRKVGDQFE